MSLSKPKPKRKRNHRFLRYRLRSVLIMVIILAVFMSWYVYRVERQKSAVRWVEENGGFVAYDYEPWKFFGPYPIEERVNPNFVGRILGDNYVSNIVTVRMGDVDNIELLRSLPHIEELMLEGTSTTDLSPLLSLSKLKTLIVSATAIGDISVICGLTQLESLQIDETNGSIRKQDEQELRKALPDLQIRYFLIDDGGCWTHKGEIENPT